MVYHNLYRGPTIVPRSNTAQILLNIAGAGQNTAQGLFNINGGGQNTAQILLNITGGYSRSHQTRLIIREVLRVTN
jgi:hypothetical protein